MSKCGNIFLRIFGRLPAVSAGCTDSLLKMCLELVSCDQNRPVLAKSILCLLLGVFIISYVPLP